MGWAISLGRSHIVGNSSTSIEDCEEFEGLRILAQPAGEIQAGLEIEQRLSKGIDLRKFEHSYGFFLRCGEDSQASRKQPQHKLNFPT